MTACRGPNEKDALLNSFGKDAGEQEVPIATDVHPGGRRKTQSVDLTVDSCGDRRSALTNMKNRHRKHMSSISELIYHLEPVRDDFVGTAKALGQSFRLRLESLDRGDKGFSLTRSLSVLPDDLDELIEEVGLEVTLEATGTRASGPPVVQYLGLLAAVAAVSSNATALHRLDDVAPPLKLFWRMTASYLVLAPLAIHALCYKDGLPRAAFL
jgi:hypothetical protein